VDKKKFVQKMTDATTLMYVFMGVMYVVLFIVVGTLLVFKKRQSEAREHTDKEIFSSMDQQQDGQEGQEEIQTVKRKRLEDMADTLEGTLGDSEETKTSDIQSDEKTNLDKKED
jgi:hypothetical protein